MSEMTDDRRHGVTVSTRGEQRGAMMAVAVVAALLVPLLCIGGAGVLDAMATPPVIETQQDAQSAAHEDADPTAPGADDPASPPDRGSDQPPAPAPEDTIYAIQAGDTLTSISAKLGVSVDAIAEFNAVRDLDVISAGAMLRLPYVYVPPVVD